MTRPLPRPLPSVVGQADLAFPAIHQACADADVPLRDRYGWALAGDVIERAVKAARAGRSIKAGVEALVAEVTLNGLELCPDHYDDPADDDQLRVIVKILRSPIADETRNG